MDQFYRNKKAFSLIEMVVVITIVGIIATWASVSIGGAYNHHKQIQAARLIRQAVKEVRTFCMATSFDTSNQNFYYGNNPTRLACGVHFYKGWTNPRNQQETGATWADGGANDDYELSFSLLTVLDNGSETVYRKVSPDYSDSRTYDGNLNTFETLSTITDTTVRSRIINLPEGVVLRFGDSSDEEEVPKGAVLGDVNYISYNAFGRLNTVQYSSPGDWAGFSPEFLSSRTYISIQYDPGGQGNSTIVPVYLDLRTGDLVKNSENIQSLTWPTFTN